MHKPDFKLLLAAMIFTVITACGPQPTKQDHPVSPDTGHARVQELIQNKDYSGAARLLLQLATQALPPQKQRLQLQAASLLIRASNNNAALKLLQTIDTTGLNPEAGWRKQLLLGEIYLLDNKPELALAAVKHLPATAPAELRKRTHDLRANAFHTSGNLLETARERILLAPFLTDQQEQQHNTRAIWTALSQLSSLALLQLRVEPPPDVLSGWLELAWLFKKARLNPETLATNLGNWNTRYPGHPAAKDLLARLLEQHKALQKRPEVLALMLPLTGKYADASKAIRDGFLSAHLNNRQAIQATKVLIYDTTPYQDNIWGLYQKVVKDGASVIIGPLTKKAVSTLSRGGQLTVPVLALNIADFTGTTAPSNFYQFGLSPEDEASQVAERATLAGHTRAVVIVPRGNWGERISQAFRKRFEELGGEVLEEAPFTPGRNDFSLQIRRLFNLDESNSRFRLIRQITGQRNLKFEPRRRQDIDFVFMAAFPRQARLIAPLIRFHHGGDLPVYATSHAWTGVAEPSKDRDMNGIILCDAPWTLNTGKDRNFLYSLFEKNWPAILEKRTRLIALGIDAYNIIPYLAWLKQESHERFPGETGSLYIDKQGKVLRRLQWARFIRGKARLIKQDISTTKPATGKALPATR